MWHPLCQVLAKELWILFGSWRITGASCPASRQGAKAKIASRQPPSGHACMQQVNDEISDNGLNLQTSLSGCCHQPCSWEVQCHPQPEAALPLLQPGPFPAHLVLPWYPCGIWLGGTLHLWCKSTPWTEQWALQKSMAESEVAPLCCVWTGELHWFSLARLRRALQCWSCNMGCSRRPEGLQYHRAHSVSIGRIGSRG